MKALKHLFENNRAWAERILKQDPDFFAKLLDQQAPKYLWIGCSDSRVPANQIVGLLPGEVFVHRNVANLVVHSDLNCLSVVQYAVEVLQVKHIIVCGHYRCGGVQAALNNRKLGLIDNWLQHIQDIKQRHINSLEGLGEKERWKRLCELNVIENALNVTQTTIVRNAWENGQNLTVHSWIYGLKDGMMHDLNLTVSNPRGVLRSYNRALEILVEKGRK